MAKFRSTTKATSRPRAAVNTDVHGHDPIHESSDQLAASARHVDRSDADDTWSRPTNLSAPPPRPGYVQRWVRVRLGDKADAKRISRALREGWRPRPPDSVPADFTPETVKLEGLGSVISVDDMVLMDMPEAKFAAKRRYFEEKKARQMEAINQDLMKVEREGGISINRKRQTRVTVGRSPERVVDPD